MREFTITKNDVGKRADRFLGRAAPDVPPAAIQKAFRKKDVKRNGKPCRADERLAEGDTVRLYIPSITIPPPTRECAALSRDRIVYEDARLLVLHKPSGVPSQSGGGEAGIEDMARAYLLQSGEWSPERENGFLPSLCHRLDRGTEGLLLFAKTAEALRTLTEMIRNREVVKTYRCVVLGTPSPPEGEWRDFLWKDAKRKRVYAQKTPSPGAKSALSRYKVLRSANGKSLLEIELVTGRTHQIRVQCASRGHPIVGDGKYGKARSGGAMALCAVRIELLCAIAGGYQEPLVFEIDKNFHEIN